MTRLEDLIREVLVLTVMERLRCNMADDNGVTTCLTHCASTEQWDTSVVCHRAVTEAGLTGGQ